MALRVVTLSFEKAAEILRAQPCRLSPCRFRSRTSAFVPWKLSRSRPHRTEQRKYRGLQTVRQLYSCAPRNCSPTTPSSHALDRVHAFPRAYFPSRAVLRLRCLSRRDHRPLSSIRHCGNSPPVLLRLLL